VDQRVWLFSVGFVLSNVKTTTYFNEVFMVYVISKNGEVLMPCSPRKARVLLKNGKAKVVSRVPFTIQLIYGSSGYKQPITLGIDSGTTYIGFSAVSEAKELFGGEFNLLGNISERLTERAAYRRTRRNHLRYRKCRFLKDTKEEGWLAPSIQHKLDSHIKFIRKIKSILPINQVIIEVANFDIQKIKNPGIQGKEYQEGEQKGFSDLREYILHRDKHKCQNPKCKGKSAILQVHHLGYWKNDRTNRPENLVTLCINCHTADNHQKDGFLYGWKPKLKSFRDATFMSMVRWRLVNQLKCEHTYGVQTKQKRTVLGLEKSHHNDAFVTANGTHQPRCETTQIGQKRKNNRSLEKFYDAKYSDLRDGKKKSGKDLCSQRRSRNRENLPESLRQYRGHKISKGRKSIRKQRYSIQPQDVVNYLGKQYKAVGIQNNGAYLKMTNGTETTVKSVKQVQVVFHQKTLIYV
jgi:hypothetical protein